jgi:ubiquinone/menaquinone biosynthesis C-methylase UbiE
MWQRLLERTVLRRPLAHIYHMSGGHIYFQTLSAAVQFDLFTLLGRRGPLTRAQLAEALHIAEQPARILLLGLVTCGLLRRRGAAYVATPLADQLFNRDRPRNIADVVLWQHFINYRAMGHFHEALRANRNTGLAEFPGDEPTLYQRLAHDPALEKIFQDAMEAISRQSNHLLAEAIDFNQFKHIVDVGGGNATNIIRLAQKYPHLKADVFDFPSVCAIAREKVAAAGLSDRLGAVPGDCFADEFPTGVDGILFCHFLTIWSPEQNRALLQKACRALTPGGVVIVFNQMQHDTEDGPLSAAMGSPYFLTLATGVGMLYTWNEYEEWMRAAGCTRVWRRKLVRDHGVIIGLK